MRLRRVCSSCISYVLAPSLCFKRIRPSVVHTNLYLCCLLNCLVRKNRCRASAVRFSSI
jgi:hypothetical protein